METRKRFLWTWEVFKLWNAIAGAPPSFMPVGDIWDLKRFQTRNLDQPGFFCKWIEMCNFNWIWSTMCIVQCAVCKFVCYFEKQEDEGWGHLQPHCWLYCAKVMMIQRWYNNCTKMIERAIIVIKMVQMSISVELLLLPIYKNLWSESWLHGGVSGSLTMAMIRIRRVWWWVGRLVRWWSNGRIRAGCKHLPLQNWPSAPLKFSPAGDLHPKNLQFHPQAKNLKSAGSKKCPRCPSLNWMLPMTV